MLILASFIFGSSFSIFSSFVFVSNFLDAASPVPLISPPGLSSKPEQAEAKAAGLLREVEAVKEEMELVKRKLEAEVEAANVVSGGGAAAAAAAGGSDNAVELEAEKERVRGLLVELEQEHSMIHVYVY